MPQNKLKPTIKKLISFMRGLYQKIPYPTFHRFVKICGSSWRIIAICTSLIVFLYYPLGGWIINDINTDTSVEFSNTDTQRSTTIETISYLIRREVNDNIWTPNLPFFFPSYFLDNMPEFQTGVITSIRNLTSILAEHWEQDVAPQEEQYLKQAAKLLQYPPEIWLFSQENRLMPAPSSPSQYRKARKLLIKYNQGLSDGSLVYYKTTHDLISFLKNISINLHKTASKLETHIREESPDYIDSQADNLFYRARGLAYADYMLLKALGIDYKNILLEADVYPDWTRMLKALESAAQLNPLLIRNGEIDSSFAPNHLSAEGFYLLKARSLMQKISRNLELSIQKNKEQ